jgi:hypothetical protein
MGEVGLARTALPIHLKVCGNKWENKQKLLPKQHRACSFSPKDLEVLPAKGHTTKEDAINFNPKFFDVRITALTPSSLFILLLLDYNSILLLYVWTGDCMRIVFCKSIIESII